MIFKPLIHIVTQVLVEAAFKFALSLEHECKIAAALQTDPDSLRTRKPILFSIQKTTKPATMRIIMSIRWWRFRRLLASRHDIDRFAFIIRKDQITR
uniref:Uncharacterized protein n=1 Tax=Candidatus Kentrum sp. FM TaxID=2126340 RepID=A0A450TT51_9GAMM|nr:MAG: hypothetical protein BECKFM1743C_GA0114222_106053 [Candidatus Kentron sp. FM]VFJ72102.1 MAG: hypothetical protein BECKFM1743A_GA0114220_106243 [Candidatus Kentron sp. FM]VFK18596.1 MAG: hypothetical protein BECKFM1743B_GA0114221_105603 [Candidatus Kentron sp. FM]